MARPWSSSDSWPAGKIPAAGDTVTIPSGSRIRLDISPPALGGLDVQGELEFDLDKDVHLAVDWIRVTGRLQIGTPDAPYVKRATIDLTGHDSAEDVFAGAGSRFLLISGQGSLEVHGETRTTWTHLDGSAPSGTTTIQVAGDIDWRPGEQIVIAPTGFEPREAESRTIVAIDGRSITLDRPLEHLHYGEVQELPGGVVDQRAEVGLLSRNITIRGSLDTASDDMLRSADGIGAHIMAMGGGQIRLHGVELVNMGQRARLGRYPIHWHMVGPAAGQYVSGSSIWKSNNRCITIHATQSVRLEDNVCFDHFGHGFFLEEGAEVSNRLIRNLGILSRRPNDGDFVIPTDDSPATFWVTNPENHLIDNVAAGSEAFGFWYALPESPIGLSAGALYFPQRAPLGTFRGNVAHTNLRTGLFVDGGPDMQGNTDAVWYRPQTNPQNAQTATTAVFRDFRGYKNRDRGVWLRGDRLIVTGSVLADNHIGATFAALNTYLEDSFVAGETANASDRLDLYRGFEYYDGPVGARDVTFWGFSGMGEIPWSALGFLRSNAHTVSTESASHGLVFNDSRRVFIEQPYHRMDGDRSAVFRDGSGSITGTEGGWVVAATDFLAAPGCQRRDEWNALICPGPYAQVRFHADRSFAPATATRGDGATEQFHGNGLAGHSVFMSLLVGQDYHLDFTTAPGGLQINLNSVKPGDRIGFSVPFVGDNPQIGYSGGGQLQPVTSREAVKAGDGSVFWHDTANARLYFDLLVAHPDARSWSARLFIPSITP